MREGTTSKVMTVDRSYGEFYDFYSVSPECFVYHLVYIYIYIYVCVCVCVRVRACARVRSSSNVPNAPPISSSFISSLWTNIFV
jgi:hypothetical protein